MNERKYFIAISGEQKGPYSIDEVKSMSLSNDTLVWYKGLKDWTELKDIEELCSLVIDEELPPPLPSTVPMNVAIEKPVKIEVYKGQQNREKRKTNYSHIFAKEVVYFAKILGGCIGGVLLCYFLLYVAKYPPYVSDSQLALFEEKSKEREDEIKSLFSPYDNTEEEIEEYLKEKGYESNVRIQYVEEPYNWIYTGPKSKEFSFFHTDLENKYRKYDLITAWQHSIEKDIFGNRTYSDTRGIENHELRKQFEKYMEYNQHCFYVFFGFLFFPMWIGRYVYLFVKWVNKNSHNDLNDSSKKQYNSSNAN